MRHPPAYVQLLRSGELTERVRQAHDALADCDLCAHACHVDRLASAHGAICRTGEHAVVHSHGPHHGEERPLRGRNGSGTIFFSWCNLRCVFCQNWDISQEGHGHEVEPAAIASMMLELQDRGCHNINFVSPSHVVPQLLAAVEIAARRGLALPLVYNTGGYDSRPALALLDGVIDIYMPDMKYGDDSAARRYSAAPDYVRHNRAAVREMHRQVGDLVLDEDGIAQRGLLVRHLVLPDDLAGTKQVITFLADEISPHTWVNVMPQYHPCYRAERHPPLDRPLRIDEFERAIATARECGICRLDPDSLLLLA